LIILLQSLFPVNGFCPILVCSRLLKLESQILLSNFAFNFNLRRYIKEKEANVAERGDELEVGPARYCAPRHRMLFDFVRDDASKCVACR